MSSEFEEIKARHADNEGNMFVSQKDQDIDHLLFLIEAAREDMIKTLWHFREGTAPEDRQSEQHRANSNRAFGVDCALDDLERVLNSDGKMRVNYGE